MSAPTTVNASCHLELPEPAPWWKDASVVRALVRSTRECGLWLDFRFVGKSGSKKMAPFGSDDELIEKMRAFTPGEYKLLHENAGELQGPRVNLSVGAGVLALSFTVTGALLDERRDGLIDGLARFVPLLHRALAGRALLYSCALTTPDPYPHLRPPLSPIAPFSPGTLLDVFDLASFRKFREPSETAAVTEAPLPSGVRRERSDDLVVVRWIDSLRDAAVIAAARSREERWLAEHFKPERSGDYNAQGERRELALSLAEHPPLTFYRANTALGYKAIVASPEGEVDEQLWAEMVSWLQRRRLPDGTRLERLRLIVPLREAALAIAGRAARDGIEAVLYTDNRGQWWDPAPPGPWLD